jgi:predicted porin
MKKTLIALGTLATAGLTAHAQPALTIHGVVDAAVGFYHGNGTASNTILFGGGNQNSRLGFRGREDLGGGLFAGFDLEAGIYNDNGTFLGSNTNNQPSGATPNGGGLTFARKSTLNVGGTWGEIRLGRDYTPGFWNLFAYDAFRTGVGLGGITTQGGTVTVFRASNSIAYFTPGCSTFTCQGFFGHAMVGFGENGGAAPNRNDGNYKGLRVGYGAPKWDVAAAYTVTKNLAAGDYTQKNIGTSYDFGVAKLMLLWGEHSTGLPVAALGGGTKAPFWQVSSWIPVGPGYIPVAYTHVKRNDAVNSTANKIAIGYVYNLSKRTALYTTYARIDNHGNFQIPVNTGPDAGPTPVHGHRASGLDIGIRHAF